MLTVNPKAWFWGLAKTLVCAASSSSGANTTTVPNQSGGDLYVRRLRIKATLTVTALGALAGTPLTPSGGATAANDTLPSTATVTIMLKVGNSQIFQQEVSLYALHGEYGVPYEFDMVLPKVINKQDLSWSATNNATVQVSLELLADCIAVPVGEKPFVDA